MGGACIRHGINDKCVQIHCLKAGDHSEDLDVEGIIILEWTLGNYGEMWIGFMWLRLGTSSGLL